MRRVLTFLLVLGLASTSALAQTPTNTPTSTPTLTQEVPVGYETASATPTNTFTATASKTPTPTTGATATKTATPIFHYHCYTGTGNNASAFVGFQPDLVIIKAVAGIGSSTVRYPAIFRTSSMPANTSMGMSSIGASTTMIRSFLTFGFSLGTSEYVNSAGVQYCWYAFKAGNDMTVGSYTGNGTSQTVPTGLTTVDMAWVKTGSGSYSGIVGSSTDMPADNSIMFASEDETAEIADQITSFSGADFNVGSRPEVNAVGHTYYWVAWDDNDTYWDVGTYNGDSGLPQQIITTGCQAAFVFNMSADDGFGGRVRALQPPYTQLFTPYADADNQITYIGKSGANNVFHVGDGANQASANYYWLAGCMEPLTISTPTLISNTRTPTAKARITERASFAETLIPASYTPTATAAATKTPTQTPTSTPTRTATPTGAINFSSISGTWYADWGNNPCRLAGVLQSCPVCLRDTTYTVGGSGTITVTDNTTQEALCGAGGTAINSQTGALNCSFTNSTGVVYTYAFVFRLEGRGLATVSWTYNNGTNNCTVSDVASNFRRG